MAQAKWEIKSEDGRGWTVTAPDNIPEADVLAFVDASKDSWVNGATYAIAAEGDAPAAPATPVPSERNAEVDAAVAVLDEKIKAASAKRAGLVQGPFVGTPGGAATARAPAPRADVEALNAELKSLDEQRSKLVVGNTGQTVGGVGGAVAGAGTGVLMGMPFGPPGMAVGGVLGSILGGAAGTAAGTHLWDIPEARVARDITEAEAAELIKGRVIESLVWDGAFALIFGPGGRLLGKMSRGERMLPALKAAAKESVAWDQMAGAKAKQMSDVVAKRAAEAKPGLATQASDALGVPTGVMPAEATRQLITDIAEQSGGRVPTQGEMRGLVTGGERFVRSQSPMPFFKNDQILADAAERIRANALDGLDAAGAYSGTDLGQRLRVVIDSADQTLKRETKGAFEGAANVGVRVDMRNALKELDTVLFRDTESAGSLLAAGERARLTALRDSLKEEPYMSPQGVQDFISGQKSALRGMAGNGERPSEYMSKVLGNLVGTADQAYLATLTGVKDKTIVRDLLAARKLYRETMGDLYSDTMATLARKNPEDVGRALTGKGTVTEIREMRAALDRAVTNAPAKNQLRGAEVTELGQQALIAERARIDAGLIKGFIEKNTQTLTSLGDKLRDPDFRITLKELLVGQGVADPKLGRKILEELDRTLGVLKLIRPEMAPQPGRVGVPGVGGVGAGTVAAAATGDIRTAAPLVFFTLGATRVLGNVLSKAMTTGNLGVLRTVQRAAALAPAAGKNVAAAEALRSVLHELDSWDRSNGGAGLDLSALPAGGQ